MKEGRLGYNSYNKRYGLLSLDLWIDTGFHCGECLEVLLDDEWVQTRMEMNPAREMRCELMLRGRMYLTKFSGHLICARELGLRCRYLLH